MNLYGLTMLYLMVFLSTHNSFEKIKLIEVLAVTFNSNEEIEASYRDSIKHVASHPGFILLL